MRWMLPWSLGMWGRSVSVVYSALILQIYKGVGLLHPFFSRVLMNV